MADSQPRTIPVEQAADLFEQTRRRAEGDEKATVTVGPWSYVITQLDRVSRWMNCYWMVLRNEDDGTFWGVFYQEGRTELQEDQYPWIESRLQKPPGFCELVQLYPRTVTTVEFAPHTP